MLSGISVVCFGASYSVALLLEISRLFFRLTARTAVMIGFAAAGLVAHSVYLGYQFREHQVAHIPIVTWFTGCLILAWILVLIYLVVFMISRQATAGILLLPASLVMIVVGHLFPSTARAVRTWNVLHGSSLLLGMAMVVIGFVAGLMYLLQSHRLKQKLPPPSKQWLPSLERLETINERCLLVSVAMLGFGLISGILLNLVRAGSDRVIPWTDPVVIASFVWLAWLVAVVAFLAFYRPARQGRKVAYMTISSFAFLGIVLAIIWWMPSPHTDGSTESQRPMFSVGMNTNRIHWHAPASAKHDAPLGPVLLCCGRRCG